MNIYPKRTIAELYNSNFIKSVLWWIKTIKPIFKQFSRVVKCFWGWLPKLRNNGAFLPDTRCTAVRWTHCAQACTKLERRTKIRVFWPPCSPSQSCISLLSAHWFFQAWNKLTKLPFNCCFDLYNNVLITTLGSSSVLLITWLPLPVGASQNVKRHQTKLNTELNILSHPSSSNYSPKVSVLSAYLQNSFKNDFVLKASLKTKP